MATKSDNVSRGARMTKRRPKVRATLDIDKAQQTLLKWSVPEDRRQMGIERLQLINATAHQMETDKVSHKRWATLAELFEIHAAKLEELTKLIDELEKPRHRHLTEPSSLTYVPGPGWHEFRDTMSPKLLVLHDLNAFAPYNIGLEQLIEVKKIDRSDRERPPIRGYNPELVFHKEALATLFHLEAHTFTSRTSRLLAQGLMSAAGKIRASSKTGSNKYLEQFIATNVVKLWADFFDGKGLSFSEKNRRLIEFTDDLCRLVIEGFVGGEHFVKMAIDIVRENNR